MRKTIFIILIFTTCFFSAIEAQVYEKKTVQSGASLSALSYYLFPSFTRAAVRLRNGELSSKMNFNLLTCQMQFIDPHGDTLNIAHPTDIVSISLDSSLFFYEEEGYYEFVSSNNPVQLAILRKVNYEPVKIGALGLQNNSGTGIQSYTSIVSQSGEKQLIMNEDVNILKETTYLLVNNSEKFKADKSNFLKLFSRNRQLIETYVKQSKPDFKNESDLKKLYRFCTNLN